MKGAYWERLVSNFVPSIQIFSKLISNIIYNHNMGATNDMHNESVKRKAIIYNLTCKHFAYLSSVSSFKVTTSTVIIVSILCWIHGWQLRINLHITQFIWSLSISAVNTAKYIPRINKKFHYTTQLWFLQDCYFPLEQVILMTTDYDRRLV